MLASLAHSISETVEDGSHGEELSMLLAPELDASAAPGHGEAEGALEVGH